MEKVPDTQTFRWDGSTLTDLGLMRHGKAERVDEVLRIVEASETTLATEEIAGQTDYSEKSVYRWLTELAAMKQVVRIEGKATSEGREPDRWNQFHPAAHALSDGHETD